MQEKTLAQDCYLKTAMRRHSDKCPGDVVLTKTRNQKDAHFAQEAECLTCHERSQANENSIKKFVHAINKAPEILTESFESWIGRSPEVMSETNGSLLDITVQTILKKIWPKGNLIYTDCLKIDSQFDHLAIDITKLGSMKTIAIEQTQAINEKQFQFLLHLDKNKRIFPLKNSDYNYILTVNKILSTNKLIEYININDSIPPKSQLDEMGITYYSKEQAKPGTGSLIIQGPISTSTLDVTPILELLKVVLDDKSDNRKKLEIALTDEKHLFIPITYSNEIAFFLSHFFKKETPLQLDVKIPNFIDVIWLATLNNFTPDEQRGFQLAKITRARNKAIMENISKGVVPYSSNSVTENVKAYESIE